MGSVWKMFKPCRAHQSIICRTPSVSPMPRSVSVRMAKTGSRIPASDCSGLSFITRGGCCQTDRRNQSAQKCGIATRSGGQVLTDGDTAVSSSTRRSTSEGKTHGYFPHSWPRCCGWSSTQPRSIIALARRENILRPRPPWCSTSLAARARRGWTRSQSTSSSSRWITRRTFFR